MGFRNATIRQMKVLDLTTTVLTLTITGIAADSGFAGSSNTNWLRRFGAVASMFADAVIGALRFNRFGLAAPLALGGLAVLSGTLICVPRTVTAISQEADYKAAVCSRLAARHSRAGCLARPSLNSELCRHAAQHQIELMTGSARAASLMSGHPCAAVRISPGDRVGWCVGDRRRAIDVDDHPHIRPIWRKLR